MNGLLTFYLYNENNGHTGEVTKEEFKNEASKQGVHGATVSFYNPKTKQGGFISGIWPVPNYLR